jgi:hypothetical protein
MTRRPMRRIGDLLPETARSLGLEEELRLARAVTAFDALVGERVPGAAGAARLLRANPAALIVEVDHPVVGQEVRLRAEEILDAFAAMPGGVRAVEIRLVSRRG